ncbi:MAG: ferrochelatase [Pseudomonadota bacterium]|nr:ferrochelatase [Pseudomonadota bacterium]
MSKIAVVLFNLGGPDKISSVRPFLFNLFNDPAIIDLPQPLRAIAAFIISLKRSKTARGIYQQMGGKSPILEQTTLQAEALEKKLTDEGKKRGEEYKVFVSMRYWHPMSPVVVKNVNAFAPDHVLLLPLYPQYSETTTGSSFLDWDATSRREGLAAPSTKICCYPTDLSFIAAHAKLIRDMYWKASEEGQPRMLFSAHGLPEKLAAKGDPYQWQVGKTVAAVTQILAIDELDYRICYQSRVGSLEWIGPSTEEEILQAGTDKKPLLVVPISFVSEHSETLVELDIEYRKLADRHGVPGYWRVPALSVEPLFIESLANLCLNADRSQKICSFSHTRHCPRNYEQCPCE